MESNGARSTGHDRGCLFFNAGTAYVLRLLVAIFSLRRFYEGPITVVLVDGETDERLVAQLEELGCEVAVQGEVSKSWDRHRLFLESPYATTLVFDSDLLFLDSIEPLWAPLEREGVLVTRFSISPYGVGGSPDRPGWSNRLALLEGVRPLIEPETWEKATRRLVDERIDVNVGVMGISRPRGDAFLTDWSERMERGRASRIDLMDEMLVVALLADHRHELAEEAWNCPADEFFRTTNLADANVIHYFADSHLLLGSRLGRNPATWAGQKWIEAHDDCARHLDLHRWRWKDPTYPGVAGRLVARGVGATRFRARVRAGRVLGGVRSRVSARLRERTRFRPQNAWWALRRRLGLPVRLGTRDRATVIILSYKRMENIRQIVDNALLCGFVERVIVCNNNPDVDLAPRLMTITDDRLELLQQDRRRWPSHRYDIARTIDSDYFICIDDDVFPTPRQLRKLFVTLLRDPDVPVGSAGERYDPAQAAFTRTTPGARRVDLLMHTYVFTRRHLDRYFELLDELGLANEEVHSSEDVILSFTGPDRPATAAVGRVRECPSCRDREIATHQQDGFEPFRLELFHRLSEQRG